MKDCVIKTRNQLMQGFYVWILKPILFQFDAENIHDFFIKVGKFMGKSIITQKI